METVAGLKQLEGQISIVGDKAGAMKAKVEDLLFRAQRIASAQKNKMTNNDSMFGYDLQNFRRSIRTFSMEMSTLPTLLGSLERTAAYEPAAQKFATSVMRQTMRLSQAMRSLHDTAVLAHQHIRAADHKIEAWYMAQEIEELVMRVQGLPTSANKIVIAVSTPPAGGAPKPAAGPPPGAAPAPAPAAKPPVPAPKPAPSAPAAKPPAAAPAPAAKPPAPAPKSAPAPKLVPQAPSPGTRPPAPAPAPAPKPPAPAPAPTAPKPAGGTPPAGNPPPGAPPKA
jgi:hypothetical protein